MKYLNIYQDPVDVMLMFLTTMLFRDLGAVKEGFEAEWELVKFMGQEENMELREKLENLAEDIQDQQVLHSIVLMYK